MMKIEHPATVVDRDTFTITFRRSFAASPERVFDAWTKAEQLALWWDPTGVPLTRCTIDARVGGSFAFENAGHSPPFTGTYHVVERPSKLVFDALGAVGTVSLETRGARTEMTVTIRCASAEHFAHFLEVGVAVNTDRTLDQLVARLETSS